MNYYLVSEEELEELKGAAFNEAVDQWEGNEPTDRLDRAKLACRARPSKNPESKNIEKMSKASVKRVVVPEISKKDPVRNKCATDDKASEMAQEIYIRMVSEKINIIDNDPSKVGIFRIIKETAELAASFYFNEEAEKTKKAIKDPLIKESGFYLTNYEKIVFICDVDSESGVARGEGADFGEWNALSGVCAFNNNLSLTRFLIGIPKDWSRIEKKGIVLTRKEFDLYGLIMLRGVGRGCHDLSTLEKELLSEDEWSDFRNKFDSWNSQGKEKSDGYLPDFAIRDFVHWFLRD